jgi:hypothetical protein
MIYEDAPHHFGCDGKKVRPTAPVHGRLVDKS